MPAREVVLPHIGDPLLEHRGALGVGDAVEAYRDRGDVGDAGRDGVTYVGMGVWQGTATGARQSPGRSGHHLINGSRFEYS
jgi:hypothetical protein